MKVEYFAVVSLYQTNGVERLKVVDANVALAIAGGQMGAVGAQFEAAGAQLRLLLLLLTRC